MKTTLIQLSRLLAVGLLMSLTACKEPVLDEYPQILSLSLSGIPQQNITIDQAQHLITVVVPNNLPSLTLVPSFTLSPQAYLSPYWTKNQPVVFGWPSWYGNLVPDSMLSYARVDNQKHATEYTIRFTGNGLPLRIKPLPTPIVYDSKSTDYTIIVPVENYFGSPLVEYIALTPTGSPSPNWLGPGGGPMAYLAGSFDQLSISLSGYRVGPYEHPSFFLKPGLHDLDFWLTDGTKVHAQGYLLIQ